jgi:hypothetical protein
MRPDVSVEISESDWAEIISDLDVPKEYQDIIMDWTDGDEEASFCGVIRDSRFNTFYSFSAWHDYTGWDCRSGVSWFGPYATVKEVVSYLTQENRRALGLEDSVTFEGLFRDEA